MTTRNKKKLAALSKENCEEHPRSNLAQNSSAPRSQEDYITQVSEEIEGGVTKRLSKEFSRTENRTLGARARLDDFLMNSLLPGHSGTTPEPSRNALNTSQGTNEDDSQNDPRPEAGLFHGQMTQSSGPEERHDIYYSIVFHKVSPQYIFWTHQWATFYKLNPALKLAITCSNYESKIRKEYKGMQDHLVRANMACPIGYTSMHLLINLDNIHNKKIRSDYFWTYH